MADEKKTAQEKLKGTVSEAILKDIAAGRELGKDLVAPGELGRLDTGVSADIQDIIQRRRGFAEGLTGEQQQGARDVAASEIGRATSGQSRALAAAQARSGVRGATAAAQQSQVLGEGADRRSGFERDLLLANRDAQERGVTGLEASLQEAEAGELAKQQFNFQQLAREKNIELTGGLGIAQLGVAERGALRAGAALGKTGGGDQIGTGGNFISSALGGATGILGGVVGGASSLIGGAVKSVSKVFCFAAGTPIEMEDGTFKPVENINIGDFCAFGGKVHACGQALTDDTYEWNNTIVSGSHAILEHGKWIRVVDSLYSKFIGKELVVYPVCNEGHLLLVNGQVTADLTEVDGGNQLGDDQRLVVMNKIWGELGNGSY